jgi:hypothetical protein
MAVDAGKTTTGMRACEPVGLDALLMTLETDLILNLGRFSGIFPERNLYADTPAAPFSHVLAPRTVTALAGPFLKFIPGIKEEDFPHHRLRELFKLRCDGLASADQSASPKPNSRTKNKAAAIDCFMFPPRLYCISVLFLTLIGGV